MSPGEQAASLSSGPGVSWPQGALQERQKAASVRSSRVCLYLSASCPRPAPLHAKGKGF